MMNKTDQSSDKGRVSPMPASHKDKSVNPGSNQDTIKPSAPGVIPPGAKAGNK